MLPGLIYVSQCTNCWINLVRLASSRAATDLDEHFRPNAGIRECQLSGGSEGIISLVAQRARQEKCAEESERQYSDKPNYWQPRFASKMSIDPDFSKLLSMRRFSSGLGFRRNCDDLIQKRGCALDHRPSCRIPLHLGYRPLTKI
jgi:hypothetical protein